MPAYIMSAAFHVTHFTAAPTFHHLLHHLCRVQQHLDAISNILPMDLRTHNDTMTPCRQWQPDHSDPEQNRAIGNFIYTLSQPLGPPSPSPPTPAGPTVSANSGTCPAAAFSDEHEALEHSSFTKEVVNLFDSPLPILMAATAKATAHSSTTPNDGKVQLHFISTPSFSAAGPDTTDPAEEAVSEALARDWKLQDDQLLVQLKQEKRGPPSWTAVAKRLGREVEDCKDRWAILKQHNLEELQDAIPPDLLSLDLATPHPDATSAFDTERELPQPKRPRQG